ncbi:hypothetical protein PoB_001444700 [Plakobranchus ocellatus]|uniref:Uncharacterized protein n=1 Tax=Plakobranchus ocellatus TaxID=259542 RepID=A0AAV3Z081_9GAST|nr:hypothetical protein PoB_001444700 [Plakobranchus ocellatus]
MTRQAYPFIAQPNFQRKHLQQRTHQHGSSSQSPAIERYSSLQAPKLNRCTHLKCCHDQQRRQANLLHLRNKFYLRGVHSGDHAIHEPIVSEPIGKFEYFPEFSEDQTLVQKDVDYVKRFRISEGNFKDINSTRNNDNITVLDSSCSTTDINSPSLPNIQNRIGAIRGDCDDQTNHPNTNNASRAKTKAHPAAIRIPCGRDGSFFEAESPRPKIAYYNHTSSQLTTKMSGPNERIPHHLKDALPFRVWKRQRASLGGTVYSDPVQIHGNDL